MKSNSNLIILSIVFFVFAGGFSVVFWGDISLAAKIGLFALGFGSGVTAGQWLTGGAHKFQYSHRLVTEAAGRSLAAQKTYGADLAIAALN